MPSANTTNNAALLKTSFQNRPPAWTGYETSKFYAEVKKDTGYGGDDKATVNVTLAAGSGVSAEFEEALRNMDATEEAKFELGFKKLYSLTSIDGSAIARARSAGKHAIAAILDHNIKFIMEKHNRAMGQQLWSIGGAAMGRIDTPGASTTLTLTNASDTVYFEVNDYIQFSSTTSGGSLRDSGKRLRVTAVDAQAGELTVDANTNTIAGITTNDYIFRAGTYDAAFSGIRAWIPTTAPTVGDSFKGVDRSVNVNRLSGIRTTGTGGSKLESVNQFLADCGLHSARPNRLFVNPLDFGDLSDEITAKTWVPVAEDKPTLGHKGLLYESPAGTLTIVAEQFCPEGYAYGLNMSTWRLRTAGPCPMILNEDNVGRLLRSGNSDAYVFRGGCYGELECQDPGQNGVLTW